MKIFSFDSSGTARIDTAQAAPYSCRRGDPKRCWPGRAADKYPSYPAPDRVEDWAAHRRRKSRLQRWRTLHTAQCACL